MADSKKKNKMDEEHIKNEASEEQAVENEACEAEGKEETNLENEEATEPLDKLGEITDKYLRLSAEFDNYRKRTVKEKDSMFTDGKAHCASAFLPLMDNLDRAIISARTETNPKSVLEGMEMILKQLYDILKNLEIEEIPAKGEEFDPECHNAVMHIEDETIDTNTVVEEFQKGYIMNGRVLRHSMVKVAN